VRIDAGHRYYGYVVVINEDELGVDRDTLIEALEAEGVKASPMRYQMLHQCPLYRDLPLIDGVPALHLLGQESPLEQRILNCHP
jgi:dTDP-4-amino-4,6-dideoxygalactose transaminase